MADPATCTGCGRALAPTVRRIVDATRKIVRCDLCPKKKYALSYNDRQLLRGLRITPDD